MNLLAALLVMTEVITGSVTYYAEGVMEATYEKRIEWGHVTPCERCVGNIAVLDSENLGKVAYIKRPGQPIDGPFLITDCAEQKRDRPRLEKRGLAAEVDWHTYSVRWNRQLPRSIELFIMDRYHQ